ncbi:MAG: hypothetical protein ACJ759_22040 [Thermoanaerobaculia bacterium]
MARPERNVHSSAFDPAEPDWERYLRNLAEPSGPLPDHRVRQIEVLWEHLQRRGEKDLPLPHAMASEAGEFVMTWDRGPHHFEIEVLSNGRYDWFYLDRTSGERLGEDDHPLGTFSAEMMSRLRRTVD